MDRLTTIFTKQAENVKKSILIVYVDDMVITSDDIEEIERLKEQLQAGFKVKGLGTLKYFLSIEIARSNKVFS